MAQVENAKDSKQVIVNLTMTVEEARQVIWQGSGPREPIGQLLDNNQIGYRDLAWAVDKAYRPEVRAAARTLLAHWLGEPATLEATRRFGPEVIEGSHFLREQELDSLMNGTVSVGVIIGFILGAVVTSLSLIILDRRTDLLLPALVLFVITCLSAVWVFFRQVKPQVARYQNFRQGREGEDAVVEELRTVLDSHWTIFRNLQLPDRKDDIDIALVGPDGVWAIEVKAFGGTVRTKGDAWESLKKGKWVRLRDSPSVQAKRNAVRLRDFLQRSGVRIRWINAAVTMAEPQPIENFAASEDLAYWFFPTLEREVANLITRHTPPTEDEVKRIVETFRELATKQIAVEEAKYKK